MKCEDAINKYCMLDKNESLPFAVSMHILFCPHCKKYIDTMEECNMSFFLSSEVKEEKVSQVMEKITQIQSEYETEQTIKSGLLRFILGITVFIIVFILFPIFKWGNNLTDTLGLIFSLPLGLLCAFIVSIISALFVIKNSRYLIKKFDIDV